MIIESSGGSKTDFFNMQQGKQQNLAQFAKAIRDAAQILRENGHIITDVDCRDVMRKGFLDPSRDQTIRAYIAATASLHTFATLQLSICCVKRGHQQSTLLPWLS